MIRSCEQFFDDDGDLLDCECGRCGKIWWMPLYGDDVELSSPKYCPSCGMEIEFTLEVDENDD